MNNMQIGSRRILGSMLIVVLLSLLCYGCSKDENPEVDDLIVGTWVWVETINAWSGVKYTPDSEGYSKTSIYKNDNTVDSYKDGDLVQTESYQTREKVYNPDDPNSETAMILIINESESYFSIRNDTLTISQAHVDGPAIFFKRIE